MFTLNCMDGMRATYQLAIAEDDIGGLWKCAREEGLSGSAGYGDGADDVFGPNRPMWDRAAPVSQPMICTSKCGLYALSTQ